MSPRLLRCVMPMVLPASFHWADEYIQSSICTIEVNLPALKSLAQILLPQPRCLFCHCVDFLNHRDIKNEVLLVNWCWWPIMLCVFSHLHWPTMLSVLILAWMEYLNILPALPYCLKRLWITCTDTTHLVYYIFYWRQLIANHMTHISNLYQINYKTNTIMWKIDRYKNCPAFHSNTMNKSKALQGVSQCLWLGLITHEVRGRIYGSEAGKASV